MKLAFSTQNWRGLSWHGVTYGSRSVLLWDRPRDPYFLREEPYMKNRLYLSVCAMTERSIQPMLEEIDRFMPEYISGSASATIAAQLATKFGQNMLMVAGLIMSGLVAGLTVGGKAVGKTFAINSCTKIVTFTGKFIHFIHHPIKALRKKKN